MKHFLITRFNLNYGDVFPYSEAWMAHRMDLFARFCLPSVQRQESQDFRWLVYFDRRCTAAHRARLDPLFDDPRFEAIHIDAPAEMISDIRARADFTPVLLTTRLDNDDLVHPAFVGTVQACAQRLIGSAEPLPAVIDAPVLTWWEEGAARAQRLHSKIISPFASVLEMQGPQGWETGHWGTGPRTVFIARHENLGARLGHVVTLPDPLSLTLLHGQNVSNGQVRFGLLGRVLRRWRARSSYLSPAETRRALRTFGLERAS